MINSFDASAVLKVTLDQIGLNEGATNTHGDDLLKPGRGTVPIIIYTDSRSLYDGLVSLNTTTEKRLLIDLHLLRQAYERREIAEVCWIPTEQNPADALTKEKPTAAMRQLLQGTLELTPNAWVDRLGAPSWTKGKSAEGNDKSGGNDKLGASKARKAR